MALVLSGNFGGDLILHSGRSGDSGVHFCERPVLVIPDEGRQDIALENTAQSAEYGFFCPILNYDNVGVRPAIDVQRG